VFSAVPIQRLSNALAKNLLFIIQFPLPSFKKWAVLWQSMFPSNASVESKSDFESPGAVLQLSRGGTAGGDLE